MVHLWKKKGRIEGIKSEHDQDEIIVTHSYSKMKFITPTLISLTIFCGVSLAAPAVSNDATAISCTPAYTGKLYVAN